MALLPPGFVDSVVAIGVHKEGEAPEWVATGFFYGHPIGTAQEDGKRPYRVYLVSNRHVFQGLNQICLRFSPQEGGPVRDYELRLVDDDADEPLWFSPDADDADVAVRPVLFKVLRDDGMRAEFLQAPVNVRTISELADMGVMEGDFVYTLGYPMGLAGERPTVIARMGIIARIRDTQAGAEKTFLVDSTVFPGNSGGPVIIKPEMSAVGETKPIDSASLIGVVAGYVPYADVAISRQTERPRIIFEENSGLAIVYPVDLIQEAISQHEAILNEAPAAEGGSHGSSNDDGAPGVEVRLEAGRPA